jgi:hypothetical protein
MMQSKLKTLGIRHVECIPTQPIEIILFDDLDGNKNNKHNQDFIGLFIEKCKVRKDNFKMITHDIIPFNTDYINEFLKKHREKFRDILTELEKHLPTNPDSGPDPNPDPGPDPNPDPGPDPNPDPGPDPNPETPAPTPTLTPPGPDPEDENVSSGGKRKSRKRKSKKIKSIKKRKIKSNKKRKRKSRKRKSRRSRKSNKKIQKRKI